jgi:uroporphyrinogen-III synthase/uncharacterized protein HemX
MDVSRVAPLAGLGVLVTRPAHQSEGLRQSIEAAGGRAFLFPLIEIRPLPDPARALDWVGDLARYDIAIFVSANAVDHGLDLVDTHGGSLATIEVIAVGTATARRLEARGVTPAAVPGEASSEGVLGLAMLQAVAGKHVLIFRGIGGRELMAEGLRARGAVVDYAEVYERRATEADPKPLLALWDRGEIGAAVVTSAAALERLASIAAGHERVLDVALVVLSERLATRARALGFRRPILATDPGDAGLLSALTAWRTNPSHTNQGPLATSVEDLMNDEHPNAATTASEPPDRPPAVATPPGPVAPDRAPEPDPAAPHRRPEPAPLATPGWLLWVSPALVVLASAAAFAWWLFGYSPSSAGTQNRIAEIGAQLDGLRQEVDAGARSDSDKLTRLEGATEEQQRLQAAHGVSIEKLALLASQDSEDLIFAEIGYLLGIAQQRLGFERDVPTAIRALEAADQRLMNLIRPDLDAVRAVFMSDMNALRAVPVVDITGPALYLADVLGRLDALPFQGGLVRQAVAEGRVVARRPSVKSLDEAAARVWGDLMGLVSIKPLGSADPRIFDPDFQTLIERQIQLEITNARLELSRRGGAAFKATLVVLSGLFGRYYDGADQAVADTIKRLAEMRSLELSPPVPDVAKSIKALREYMLARRKLVLPAARDAGATGDVTGAAREAATPERAREAAAEPDAAGEGAAAPEADVPAAPAASAPAGEAAPPAEPLPPVPPEATERPAP